MHGPTCCTCAPLTRPEAYRWIGIPNPVPVSHGCGWLGWDIRETLRPLLPGGEATLDYRGVVDGAPTITVRAGDDGMLTATVLSSKGTVYSCTHPPIGDEFYAPMSTAILEALVQERGARGVIIVGSHVKKE